MNDVSETMRADWNRRAREDAHYYVAFGGRDQDDQAFESTAAEVVGAIEAELKRLPESAGSRALEIGCGPGRLMKPLSRHFSAIDGVDVSDEMIRLARERLRDIPHARAHATDGASLGLFADNSFDLVYSYAVFQHIPSRDVVLAYMREIRRVLKPGGIFRGQFNGLPPAQTPDTWRGVSFSVDDIRQFTRDNGLQLLALDGADTQYMWTTWRKRPGATPATGATRLAIHRITNALSSEPVAPQTGRLAAISLLVSGLSPEDDLTSLDLRVDDVPARCVYIGPVQPGGLQQINAMLPAGVRTGLVPVALSGARAYIRVIPSGPLTPRVVAVTDGIDMAYKNRSTTGWLKLQLEEIAHPEAIRATIDGLPVRDLEIRCTDPLPPRYEINFRVPEGIRPGKQELRVAIGARVLPPLEIQLDG